MSGGLRERTPPDFFIGAHAVVAGLLLLTCDAARYRNCFPDLDIMSPETYP
jgi:predicted nucleic acid-binding protein